ncbi:hypothetical protein WJX81_004546 [Elliptochloris bilobata]|uniref:Uncharacterized protein n=1 Tax=Elliptochloris bilobata TaxID=381761 RepID=A0AAW1RNR8_9CHLO
MWVTSQQYPGGAGDELDKETSLEIAQRMPQRSTSEIDKYMQSTVPAQPMATSFSCTAAYPKAYPSRPGQGTCAYGMRKPSLKGPNPFEQARLAAMASASAQ